MAYGHVTTNCASVDGFHGATDGSLSCIYRHLSTIAINKEERSPQHLTRGSSHGATTLLITAQGVTVQALCHCQREENRLVLGRIKRYRRHVLFQLPCYWMVCR